VELRLRRAAEGDRAMFRYDLGGGVNVSLTNHLDFRLRTRPENGVRVVAYAEASGALRRIGCYTTDGVWVAWRVDLLKLLSEAGVEGPVTGLVFELVREGAGRVDCCAEFDYLRLSGSAALRGAPSSLFFEDGV